MGVLEKYRFRFSCLQLLEKAIKTKNSFLSDFLLQSSIQVLESSIVSYEARQYVQHFLLRVWMGFV